MNGIINVFKEKDYTSHDVVAIIRRLSGIKKCGHTGTLDPMAEGVLPVCLGRATKLASYIMEGDKRYIARFKLGIETNTEDIWGEITAERAVDADFEDVKKAAESFLGEISQIPPMYSAIKKDGKKLYQLAREGKVVDRPARKVYINEVSVGKAEEENEYILDVSCSKGTYIRTLCADIGQALGCGATMTSLLRVKTGAFSLEKSIKLDELRNLAEKGRLNEVLIPVEEAVSDMKRADISPEFAKTAANGVRVPAEMLLFDDLLINDLPVADLPKEGDVLALFAEKKLLGIYDFKENQAVPRRLI